MKRDEINRILEEHEKDHDEAKRRAYEERQKMMECDLESAITIMNDIISEMIWG